MIYREKLSCKEIPGENSYNEKKKISLMAYNAGKKPYGENCSMFTDPLFSPSFTDRRAHA